MDGCPNQTYYLLFFETFFAAARACSTETVPVFAERLTVRLVRVGFDWDVDRTRITAAPFPGPGDSPGQHIRIHSTGDQRSRPRAGLPRGRGSCSSRGGTPFRPEDPSARLSIPGTCNEWLIPCTYICETCGVGLPTPQQRLGAQLWSIEPLNHLYGQKLDG